MIVRFAGNRVARGRARPAAALLRALRHPTSVMFTPRSGFEIGMAQNASRTDSRRDRWKRLRGDHWKDRVSVIEHSSSCIDIRTSAVLISAGRHLAVTAPAR